VSQKPVNDSVQLIKSPCRRGEYLHAVVAIVSPHCREKWTASGILTELWEQIGHSSSVFLLDCRIL